MCMRQTGWKLSAFIPTGVCHCVGYYRLLQGVHHFRMCSWKGCMSTGLRAAKPKRGNWSCRNFFPPFLPPCWCDLLRHIPVREMRECANRIVTSQICGTCACLTAVVVKDNSPGPALFAPLRNLPPRLSRDECNGTLRACFFVFCFFFCFEQRMTKSWFSFRS